MKIYVASSWRNTFQPEVVAALRAEGYEVYDFKDSEGFHWTEVDPEWQSWPTDISKYLDGLTHSLCGSRLQLRDCDVCVYVMPCGVSASLEAGWACGAGKPTVVFVPGLREPDLMVKMANIITDDLGEVLLYCRRIAEDLRQ